MTATAVSIVLPVHNQGQHIADVVQGYLAALAALTVAFEVVLVPNACRDDSVAVCQRLGTDPRVRSVEVRLGGWGRAVRHGLAAARGDLLCYTNSARTTPEELAQMIGYAVAQPGTVVKANRKVRERWSRRLGSLLYNLECRALFDLNCWDVNGTPKVFPRTCTALLALEREDDLIDLEFVARCRQLDYRMLEVPIFSSRRHGGQSTTNWRSAVAMYTGALALRRRWAS